SFLLAALRANRGLMAGFACSVGVRTGSGRLMAGGGRFGELFGPRSDTDGRVITSFRPFATAVGWSLVLLAAGPAQAWSSAALVGAPPRATAAITPLDWARRTCDGIARRS